jgi:peptide/nickel transport system permease protein
MASFTFFLVRLIPGGPVEAYIANLVTQYNVARDDAVRQASALFSLDLDAPVYEQYVEYLANLARGNLGESLITRGVPVSEIILRYLPWTLFSVGVALILSFTLGILLGMLMAYKRESTLDHVLTNIGSIPSPSGNPTCKTATSRWASRPGAKPTRTPTSHTWLTCSRSIHRRPQEAACPTT